LGEPVTIPTGPAIANAIYAAIGVRIKDLPITPEKILEGLREKQENLNRWSFNGFVIQKKLINILIIGKKKDTNIERSYIYKEKIGLKIFETELKKLVHLLLHIATQYAGL
jgi:hypothetical protein